MNAEPESDHRSTPLAPRDAERQLTLRTAAALLCTGSAIYWGIFATGQFLVFEIADSIGSPVAAASQRVSAAGLAMFVVSMRAISAATGLLGRGAFARYLTEALLVAALGLAITANYLPRKPET